IISTAWSGADPERKGFVLPEWGLCLDGDDPLDPAYLRVGRAWSDGLPDMPVTLYDRGTSITALPGTEVVAEIVAPYFNRHWDGEHGHVYLPPDKPAGRPAVTIRGSVAHASHPLFTSYYQHAQVPMRQLISNLLRRLLPDPMLRTDGLPSFARAMVTAQPARRMVHLLAYVPERRGAATDMIEEPIAISGASVGLRVGDNPPKRVYLAPSEETLLCELDGQYARVAVPPFHGHALIVFEW
ncbi:MAG: hypothetical protein QHJ73_17525, partial [Armatimonadota bacterium]|nr:hypothetical protein [Armatimonadota bacterium]